MHEAPGWSLIEPNGTKQLERIFKFRNFAEALAFTNKVGALAEQQQHHPTILTEWGSVTVRIWTHDTKGITAKDSSLAEEINLLTQPLT
jgi:4a-hydroxytetrahydrobiopterin dehydratase